MCAVCFLRPGLTVTGCGGGTGPSEAIKAPARHPHTLRTRPAQLSLAEITRTPRSGPGRGREGDHSGGVPLPRHSSRSSSAWSPKETDEHLIGSNPPSRGVSRAHPKTSGNSWRSTLILASAGSDSGRLLSCSPLYILSLFLRCLPSTDPEVGLFPDSPGLCTQSSTEVGHRDFPEDLEAIARSIHLTPRS